MKFQTDLLSSYTIFPDWATRKMMYLEQGVKQRFAKNMEVGASKDRCVVSDSAAKMLY